MIRCELCSSKDIIRAKVRNTEKLIAVCRECGSIYEVDEGLMPILGHDPNDVSYFKSLEALFETWDDLEDVIPYNKE